MAGRTVHVHIGGQTYRVTTSASDQELQRLAAVVDQKLATVVPPGRAVTPQAMLLAAMALAHDLDVERSRSDALRTKARGAFSRMIERVDAALGQASPATSPPRPGPVEEPFHEGASASDPRPKPRAPAEAFQDGATRSPKLRAAESFLEGSSGSDPRPKPRAPAEP